ncbi:hypothetical protein N3K63_03785 [Microbacterium sp. W1N]|uniref:hypothetical protein n=1 Tax=Microbacterium festucae TaxID=2977531 RepID=UPI0021C15662|nr:hypothetical protein [Microbacterium festucae]MCT9819404.1 hypothetical protein [Microbacterium festucae]
MAPTLPFDRSARYGAAVVAMLFATYLVTATDFSAIVQSETYAGTIRNDAPLVNLVQFVIILGAMVTALWLLPTSGTRRLAGVTLVCVVLFLWAALGLERGDGTLTQPPALWDFVLNQGFVALLASVGGWVIARGRHPLTWLVVAVAALPPLIAPILIQANFSSGGYALVMQGTVIVAGLAAVWGAALLDSVLVRPPHERVEGDGALVP